MYGYFILVALLEIIIKDIEPKFIVLTGDYYDIPQGANNFRQFLQDISKEYRVLFIQGNHDFLWGKSISNLLLDIPTVKYIENTPYQYKSKKGNSLIFTGWNNREILSKYRDSKQIVLIHNPEDIIEKELKKINVIFAGHLHGCQFIFLKSKKGSFFPGNLYYKHCVDRKIIDNTTLIISKGLGDTLPLRWNCPKEVVLVTIS